MRVSVLGDVQVVCSGVFVGFSLFDSRDWVYVISLVSVKCRVRIWAKLGKNWAKIGHSRIWTNDVRVEKYQQGKIRKDGQYTTNKDFRKEIRILNNEEIRYQKHLTRAVYRRSTHKDACSPYSPGLSYHLFPPVLLRLCELSLCQNISDCITVFRDSFDHMKTQLVFLVKEIMLSGAHEMKHRNQRLFLLAHIHFDWEASNRLITISSWINH